jgi:hypothetical protein
MLLAPNVDDERFGEAVAYSVVATPYSRASISLKYYYHSFLAVCQGVDVNFLP